MSNEAPQRAQDDDCIDVNASASLTERVSYDEDGEFCPGLIDENVAGAGPSEIYLVPDTETYYAASDLTISPSIGTSKSDVGDGQVRVQLPHPTTNCGQYTWQLSFSAGGLTTPLVVKIRKTRIDPSSDER